MVSKYFPEIHADIRSGKELEHIWHAKFPIQFFRVVLNVFVWIFSKVNLSCISAY